jgi:H-type small acid-soluble spore protein
MDFNRANEIFRSPNTYEVFFKGSPVWIADLNAERLTADIAEDRFSTNRTREVSLEELVEGNQIH